MHMFISSLSVCDNVKSARGEIEDGKKTNEYKTIRIIIERMLGEKVDKFTSQALILTGCRYICIYDIYCS